MHDKHLGLRNIYLGAKRSKKFRNRKIRKKSA